MNKKSESSGIKLLGWLEKGTGKHQSNCVYSVYGLAPTICADIGVKMPATLFVVEDENKD